MEADISPKLGDSRFDPNVWSGRALQEGFVDLARMCGLASMYPASDWSVLCSEPSWISARIRSHYRTGLKWAIWVTRVRMRREDRSSISSHPLADLGRQEFGVTSLACSQFEPVPLFVPEARSLSRPALELRRRAQGAVKAGRRDCLASCCGVAGPRLDGSEHGATLKQHGTPSCSS